MAAWEKELGGTIRAARIRRGFTQEALAERLDVTPTHLKNMESGRRKPSVPLLLEMMALLDFSVDDLVFPRRQSVIHTEGLTPAEVDTVVRLVEVMRERSREK